MAVARVFASPLEVSAIHCAVVFEGVTDEAGFGLAAAGVAEAGGDDFGIAAAAGSLALASGRVNAKIAAPVPSTMTAVNR